MAVKAEAKTEVKMTMPTVEQLEEELRRVSAKKNLSGALRGTLVVLVVVAALSVLISTMVLPVFKIYGSSMDPTLSSGDVVVALRGGSYDRGDVIAFYYNNKILVKRVIAMPGETVDIGEDGTVTINGTVLDEPYLTAKSLGECDIELPYQVPEGQYFVMGDHRDVSSDSRTAAIGCVETDQIVGTLQLQVWPLGEFGLVG